jgi:hypothetical protein
LAFDLAFLVSGLVSTGVSSEVDGRAQQLSGHIEIPLIIGRIDPRPRRNGGLGDQFDRATPRSGPEPVSMEFVGS